MYNVGCLLTNLDMCVTSQCMYATMPLVRTYMYDSAKMPLKGLLCMCKTITLIRTYMCSSENFL